MERKQKKSAVTSVPQFGGWDQKSQGDTNYSMVFTQARANKKQQKTDLTEVKRVSLGNESELLNASHAHAHHHAHAHAHHTHHAQGRVHAHHAHDNAHAHDDPVVMGKRRILTYINCCIRP